MKRGYVKIGLLAFAFGCLVMSAKVDARAEEPDYSKVSYATPAKEESDWVTEGIYSYCLIRNKTAVKLRIDDTYNKTKGLNGVVPASINGLPVKEIDSVFVTRWETLVIPDGIEVLDDSAFYCMGKLKSVDLGKDVEYIGENAFATDKNLKTVTGGEGVRFVGQAAFSSCKAMTKLPAFMKNNSQCIYGGEIFEGHRALRSVTVPKNMQYTNAAFQGCKGLRYVRVNGTGYQVNRKMWKSKSKADVNRAMFKNCSKLQKVVLSNKITRLNDAMFANCTSLQKINIPKNCSYIGKRTFKNCSKLKKVTLSNKITKLNSEVFADCSALQKVNIPKKCTNIGPLAFAYCENLKTLVIPSSVKKISRWAFTGCKNLTIICEKGSNAERYAKKNEVKYRYYK